MHFPHPTDSRTGTPHAPRGFAQRSKSTKDFKATVKEYPTDPGAYAVLEVRGQGAFSWVYRAMCKPFRELVAIKCITLESLQCDLEETVHEAQTMKQYHHPNVLPLYCSFVSGQELWMVMPFINGGSVLHIMKHTHPEGLDEIIIATIMRYVLKALEYMHKQGGIHRDIKASNILLDRDGHVYLGDFGVAASMERAAPWDHDTASRKTFVGTPCWMAPEVMEQTEGYDSSADIWSFGMTLLEMAYGQPPYAKFPPMKVLMYTLQKPPPTLEDKGHHHWSKAMREVVALCLQKDPHLRPTATHLLEHKFFKQHRDPEYLVKHLIASLPAAEDNIQDVRHGKVDLFVAVGAAAPKGGMEGQQVDLQGANAWNFEVTAQRAQAAQDPQPPVVYEQQPGSESTAHTSYPLRAH